MANLTSVSTAPVAGFGDKEYYDLVGTIEVLRRIFSESVVDGFELQLEPEWDSENPPLTETDWADWTKTPKYAAEDIIELFKQESFPILSVHASRDVGSYLCSKREDNWKKGKRVMYDSLLIAETLKAKVCVFHLWDTWKTSFDAHRLEKTLLNVADQFPKVKASVENIPTHLRGYTPFRLVNPLKYITLDMRWAALYDELDLFESIMGNVVNVHLRGKLQQDKWILDRSSFDFYEALNKLTHKWKYEGLLTVEPEDAINGKLFKSFTKAMRTIKKY
jgi:sugar phosphate isomerase/epimerase